MPSSARRGAVSTTAGRYIVRATVGHGQDAARRATQLLGEGFPVRVGDILQIDGGPESGHRPGSSLVGASLGAG